MSYRKTKECIFCKTSFIARTHRAEVCSHDCLLQRRRLWHKTNGDRLRARQRAEYHNGRKAYYRRYEKTPSGLLMRMYRNMQSRVLGIQKLKAHLYKGKTLLDRESFYEWAKSSFDFWELYSEWKANGYSRKLTPTVDRIDPTKGYEEYNMRWLTHSENSRRGAINRNAKSK